MFNYKVEHTNKFYESRLRGQYCMVIFIFCTYCEYPVDGHIQSLAYTQKIGENPQNCRNERNYNHKEEEWCSRNISGWSTGHTNNAKNLQIEIKI